MHMPMREIRKKYTKSDMILMSWDSKQKSYNMSKSYQRNDGTTSQSSGSPNNGVREQGDCYILPEGVNNGVPIPKAFFDEDGQFDLRKATGEQACDYLRGLGVQLMPMIVT